MLALLLKRKVHTDAYTGSWQAEARPPPPSPTRTRRTRGRDRARAEDCEWGRDSAALRRRERRRRRFPPLVPRVHHHHHLLLLLPPPRTPPRSIPPARWADRCPRRHVPRSPRAHSSLTTRGGTGGGGGGTDGHHSRPVRRRRSPAAPTSSAAGWDEAAVEEGACRCCWLDQVRVVVGADVGQEGGDRAQAGDSPVVFGGWLVGLLVLHVRLRICLSIRIGQGGTRG